MNEEKDEKIIIYEAIFKAREAFENYLEKEHSLDKAYFALNLEVFMMSSDFKQYIHKITDEEFQPKNKEGY